MLKAPPALTAGNVNAPRDQRLDISVEGVDLMDVTAGNTEGCVVGPDGLLVGCFEQAIDLALSVVVQLDLTDAELVRPGVTGVIGNLRDCLLR
jgi:hypothetical protein